MDFISLVIIVLVSVLSSTWYFACRQKNAFNYWKKRNIPHIQPTIPYGNLEGVGEKFHVVHVIKKIYDKFKGTGAKFCGAYFFTRPIAIILDINLAKNILIKDFSNFMDRGMYSNSKDDPLSSNLGTLDGQDWKKLRNKLSPAFTSGKMKFMFPTVIHVAKQLRDVLNENLPIVNVRDFMTRYSADVIGTCTFGLECNSLNDPNAKFIAMGRLALEKPRHGARFLALITSYKKIANILRIKSLRDDVANFIMHAIGETVEYREKNQIRRNDFMDILLSLKNQPSANKEDVITFNELAAQINVFFIGAFETTSIPLVNCLFELAQNPDIQNKARNVIRKAYEKYNDQFTYEMMMDLPYIHQIVQETLRKYPVSATVNRIAKNNYCVSGTDHVIEKGTWIKVPVFAIHHDPEYYPNPEKFDPHRFDSDEMKKRPSMTWLSFGDGPRGCIGNRFALMQIYIVLVIILQNFELLICSDTIESINFHPKRAFLQSKEDLYLKLHPINHDYK